MVLYIVIAILILALGGFAAYYLARFMKGRLKLQLSQSNADSEQLIAGTLSLEAKRNIRGLLKVSLVAREKKVRRDRDGDKSTEYVEVYRYDHILEEERDFPAGYVQDYVFDLLAPTQAEVRSGATALKHAAAAAGDGVMGSVLKVASSAASVMGGRLYWHVESRLDADGVDLYTKEKCTINLTH